MAQQNKKDEPRKKASVREHIRTLKNVMIVSMLLLLGALSFFLDMDAITLFDSIQNPILTSILYAITLLGEIYLFVWVAMILLALLIINKKPVIAFISTIFVTGAATLMIKVLVNRPRPFEYLHITPIIPTQFSSFPSGHATMFFSLIPIMSKSFPNARYIFWIIAALVGISRLYFGVHYLSDVVCGAIIGYAIGYIFMKISEWHEWKY